MAWFDDITKKSEDFGPQHSLTSFQSQNTLFRLFPFTRKSLGFRLWNRKNCSIPIQPSLQHRSSWPVGALPPPFLPPFPPGMLGSSCDHPTSSVGKNHPMVRPPWYQTQPGTNRNNQTQITTTRQAAPSMSLSSGTPAFGLSVLVVLQDVTSLKP